MPDAIQISDLTYIDSTSLGGGFYVVAGTYGRGIYMRNVNGDDPIGINNENNNIATKYNLYQNYPNPFNPVTKIKYDIKANTVGQTLLSVYDIQGKEIALLVNEKLKPGTYEVEFDGTNFPSGVYFYRLSTNGFSETKKMMLIK